MSERVWDKFLTERDKAVFAAGGFGARAGFGKRPALLIIDVNWAFCGERPEPILESIKSLRTSSGEDAWVALPYIKELIDKAHAKGLPVIYTTGEGRPDKWDRGSWSWKSSRAGETGAAPPPGMNAPPLDGNEIAAPTSGCVRPTVCDAFSLNYRVILAEEGCFDRSEASHALSLCDMHAKYADVVPTAEVLSYFDTLPAGLFDLPTGAPAAPVRAAAE